MTVVPYEPTSRISTRTDGGTFNADWLLDPAEIANRIGGTDFVPRAVRNNPAAITAALLYGAELGLGPMQSLAKISVIDGRPSLAAETQRALILSKGHDLWIEESNNTRCTIAGRRNGSELTSRVTWTLDDAKRARLAGKSNWQAYPRAMLLARASAELARAIFADVIGGLAATEELDDVVDVDAPAPPPAPDGEQPTAPTTRRRRRVGTTAGSTPEPAPEPTPPPADPEPTPEPAPAPPEPDTPPTPDPPSRAQMGKLFALFGETDRDDRPARLAYSEQILGRPIGSSKELTALDASTIIDALQAEVNAREWATGGQLGTAGTGHPVPSSEGQLPADEQAVLNDLEAELDAHPADTPPAEAAPRPPLPGEPGAGLDDGELPEEF